MTTAFGITVSAGMKHRKPMRRARGRPALPDPRRRSHLSPASWVDRFRAPADLVPAQMAQQFEELW